MTPLDYLLMSFAAGYLSGSVPFGLLFTKMAGLGDIRAIGSGNIGATNVLRTGKKSIALLTLVADALKGAAPILIIGQLFAVEPDLETAQSAAALGAFMGHVFPVWLGFKGGKGIAVFIGVLLALNPIAALVFVSAWLVTAALFKISSLAALVACLAVPVAMLVLGDLNLAILCGLLALIAYWTHRENIKRLIAGQEPRIGKS
jgi:glycerol-3-phosphate acyltransferase PlsY